MTSTTAPPAGALRTLERRENFPVASRLLPSRIRRDLRAVYDVARSIDELGDDPDRTPAQRLAALDAFSAELDRVWDDPAAVATPVLVALGSTVRRCGVGPAPFQALVAANRLDQTKTRYADFEELRAYCALSANPVGHIVLAVFGAASRQRTAWSDDVCTALQLLEHCQDLGEDRRAGRVYLPEDTLTRFGAGPGDLDAPVAGPALRAAVAHEVARSRRLLTSGPPLVATLRGTARLAVAGFVAGGLATADAIERAGFDPLRETPRPRRRDVAGRALHLLRGHA